MKKIVLSLAACLLCLLMSVSVSMAEEHNMLGEWYVIAMSEDTRDDMTYSADARVLAKSSYHMNPMYDAESNELIGAILEYEGVPVFSGSFYCSEKHFFIVLMTRESYDGATYVFYTADTDIDGNSFAANRADVYFAPAETMLITPTHMFFNGSRIEYYMFDNRLFTIDGSRYAKAPLQWLNEDVFIARPQDGSDALLFVRTKD